VGSLSTLPRLIAASEDRWPAAELVPSGTMQELILASRLLGADRAVANFGGGNTSAKGRDTDHMGRDISVIWVKGSGSDLASMATSDLVELRLDDVLPLFHRDQVSDEEMVAYLARCQLDPRAPRSSIETLLHAFIPAQQVHHTHPDAINALACATDGERLVRECFGDGAAWIPYIRPGFTLAKQVGTEARQNPELRLVVLAKHGLVVWGESAEAAYRRTIEVINLAAEFIAGRSNGSVRFGGQSASAAGLGESQRDRLLRSILPVVRGAVSSERSKVLAVDTSEPVLDLVSSRNGAEVVTKGAACPDHLVHTKRISLWVPFDPGRDDAGTLGGRVRELAEGFRADYARYFDRHADGDAVSADPDPRVVLIQNLGLVGAGPSVAAARLSADLYLRAIEVMAGAQAVGEFTSLTEAESFAVEYWPLELYKLSLAPPPGELQGKVALVTGAAGGIGRAVVDALAGAGACVVGFDVDGSGAAEAIESLTPAGAGVAFAGDVTSEEGVRDAFAAAVDAFGGVDIVVSGAGVASSAPVDETTLAEWERVHSVLMRGYFLVVREAMSILRAQERGGSIVIVASKNALVAGRNVTAYSSAKAGELHLARCVAEEAGPYGVRVNTVNPDAVIQGSRIWNSSWREERAAAYRIAPEDLDRYYRDRTTLGVSVLPEDVAQAVLHFASADRSGKSTGNILNVDGGVAAAYPR
jgi:rhamnulose-1-phosphate aldolase/alcohol dehydrogenase